MRQKGHPLWSLLPPPPSCPLVGPTIPLGQHGNWMPGGPRWKDLIPSYPTHIAPLLWRATQKEAGEDVDTLDPPLTFPPHPDPMRRILRVFVRPPHFDDIHRYRRNENGSWWKLAQRSGLTSLGTLEFRRMDSVLISAFVERWHPETSSFHFPWGEITITLHDVVQILQIPIDGAAVVSHMPNDAMWEALAPILGVEPDIAERTGRRGGYGTNTTLKKRIKELCVAEERNEHHIATLYLALLVSCTLFVDKSGMNCKPHYLTVLLDHDETEGYAWGVATLAYLYRELGKASRGLTASIAGCTLLLRSWIWAYFHAFRGHASSDLDALRDNRAAARDGVEAPQGADQNRLINLRRVLDQYRYADVCWMPWGQLDFDSPSLAPSRFRGLIECFDIREPYLPDRVMRQFGRMQGIPEAPPTPIAAVRTSSMRVTYIINFPVEACQWGADPRPMIELGEMPDANFPWDCQPEYLDWWEQMSHPYLDFRSPRQDPSTPAPVDDDVPLLPGDLIRVVSAELRVYAREQPDIPDYIREHLIDFALRMVGARPLRPPPIPRGAPPPPPQPVFQDSVYEEGSGSRTQEQSRDSGPQAD
ncbi:hypothetical protein QQ045_011925 [Rhodiola kirilowii]